MGEGVTYYCPNCWEEIAKETTVCPNCHQPIAADAQAKFFDKLVGALRHPVPAKAAFAAQVLGRLRDPRGVEPLLEVLDRTHDPELQEAAIRSLGLLKDTRAVDRLSQMLNDTNSFITLRIAAAAAMGQIGSEQAIAVLQEAARKEDRFISREARGVLGGLGAITRR